MSRVTGLIVGRALCLSTLAAFAQGSLAATAPSSTHAEAAPIGYKGDLLPMLIREAWNVDKDHGGPLGQSSVSSPNLELHLYGSAKDIDPARGFEQGMQINSGPGVPGTGHIFTGLCERPCAMALRDRNNYFDLTGFGKIRWVTRVTGLHVLRPIVKLADGTWLLGEHGDGSVFDYDQNEFTLAETRWIAIDMDKVVTRGRWLDKVDLSKVDQIGFADLMPGSGHSDGGYSNLGQFEVYGKAIPRAAAGGQK